MTPLEQAMLLLQQDPAPADLEDQLIALEAEAKDTDEAILFERIWEALPVEGQPEPLDSGLTFS